jgi:hypothetical protein
MKNMNLNSFNYVRKRVDDIKTTPSKRIKNLK